MASRRKDRCGARFRRPTPDDEPHVPETQELGLTGLGEAFIEALKHDERFSEVLADPFGEQREGPATRA
jgi:DNA-binding HxlR family transcriptional regulator